MKIIQRLRNLINWSNLNAPDGYDFYTTPEGKIMIGNPISEIPTVGFDYGTKKPQAQIIKRVIVDPLEEALKEI